VDLKVVDSCGGEKGDNIALLLLPPHILQLVLGVIIIHMQHIDLRTPVPQAQ
jgi:hypothetical protein